MASGAALHATRAVKQKVLAYAGTMLEPPRGSGDRRSPRPVKVTRRRPGPVGSRPGGLFLPPEGEEPDLRSVALFTAPSGGWSGGIHVCFVEIDPETGIVRIPRYQRGRGLRLADHSGGRRRPGPRWGRAGDRHRAVRARRRYNEEGMFVSEHVPGLPGADGDGDPQHRRSTTSRPWIWTRSASAASARAGRSQLCPPS